MTTVTTVAIKLAKMYIHREKIKFELMPKDGRSYRSAMIVKSSYGPSAPWVGSLGVEAGEVGDICSCTLPIR